MTPPPPLSVVVPSRNTRHLTLACLDSLAAARGRRELAGIEVVLVDDAGDDGTAEAVAQRHGWVGLVRLDRQRGFTRAANRGMAAATGEVLLLLNSDTQVDAQGLAALLEGFAALPRLGIAGGALHYPDGTPQWSGGGQPGTAWLFGLASGLPALAARLPLYRRLRPASGTAPAEGPPGTAGAAGTAGELPVAWVTGAALAVRRSVWQALGPLDERFRLYAQDLDLCLRAGDAGWQVAVLPRFAVLHHHGATIAGEAGGPGAAGGAGGQTAGGGGAAARGAQNLELLWTDLLRWAAKRAGARGKRRAARALVWGGRMRLLGRRMLAPWTPRAERARFDAQTAGVARAVAAVVALRRAPGTAETC